MQPAPQEVWFAAGLPVICSNLAVIVSNKIRARTSAAPLPVHERQCRIIRWYEAVITFSISLLDVKVFECKQDSGCNTIRQLKQMSERKLSSVDRS